MHFEDSRLKRPRRRLCESVMSGYLLFFFFYYNICFIFYFILTLPIIIGVAGIN